MELKNTNHPEDSSSSFEDGQNNIQKLTSGIKGKSIAQIDRNRAVWIIAIVAGAIILIIGGLFISTQVQLHRVKQDLAEQKADPTILIKEENKKLIDQVGALVKLPDGEEPTIATVNDLSKLEGQQFFANAVLGDKVLIFTKAKKALLFRPAENKVIEFAPLVSSQPTP